MFFLLHLFLGFVCYSFCIVCVFAARFCIGVFGVYLVCLLNAADVLSNQLTGNLLVFCLFACVFLSCSVFAPVGHRNLRPHYL